MTPSRLIEKRQFKSGDALLCWGKAASASWNALNQPRIPHFLITPETSEHPFPGSGSFRAGQELLEFFDSLGRTQARRLIVHLSGGASSLAWVRPAGLSESELSRRLHALYRSGLDIRRVNQERSRLCALKAGGAARWLKRLAPGVRAEVELISDVEPHGPEVVGSGPFRSAGIPHHVLASNRILVARLARASPWPVLEAAGGIVEDPEQWVRRIQRHQGRSGLLILGGEPRISVRGSAGSREGSRGGSQGGRMTHLAAILALRFPDIEFLCASTDGVDGNSESSASWIRPKMGLNPARLRKAIREFDTARELHRVGALFPARPTGTNVQDVVMVKLI